MSSEPYQDASAHRIKRKPPPPFPYSVRYPEPDPSDPFAPLSVLRDRTATLTNPAYESPVAIPEPTPESSRMLDLSTFITHQRNKSTALGSPLGETGWQGYASQLRKGASMGPGLHEYSPGSQFPVAATITSATLRPGVREMQRYEARRRSQSVFALRSGTFSFLESRSGPDLQFNVESAQATRRHSLTPYGSRASVLSSSSTSSRGSTRGERKANGSPARPRSCSSSFVSATLLDGVPENLGDGVPLLKSMHVMHVDMPTNQSAEKRSESPPHLLSLPSLEKRSPSVSSIGSWSRDVAFYSAPSRPQTPSSIRSSRPVSLPPSSVFSFPRVPVNPPPTKPAHFTTSPVTTSTTPIPSTLATALPPSISNSRRLSTPPEDLDALPIQVHLRFPKQEQSAESEPESLERESGRFARLRARTSAALQARRSSTSSSLRSTLIAAAEAADKLAAEDAPIAPHPTVTSPLKFAQAPVVVSEIAKPTSLTAGTPPGSKESNECQRVVTQTRGRGWAVEQPTPAPSITHTYQQSTDGVPAISRTQLAADHALRSPPKTEVKAEPESTPPSKRQSASHGSQKTAARRSSSTPLPLSRPLPSPPAVTTHPEPMVKLSPTPMPRVHSHGLSHPQVQRFPPAPKSSMHGEPPTSLHAVHVAPSAMQPISLPAGEAPPHVVHEPTLPIPPTIHRVPSSQMNDLPPPPPPPRSVQTIPMPSHTSRASASTTIRPTSSNSSHADNTSMTSAPQLRRHDASPSSSHGRQSSLSLAERHGHHQHHHPHQHGHSRSLSESGTVGGLSSAQLTQAACLPVVRENGLRLQFGELWRMQRTVVIFIRHFWCPMCQDYLASLMRDVDHAALTRSGVRLVVIGCGSYGLIRSYRQIFRLPYEIFVDASPGQMLYRALGMGRVPTGAQKGRCSTDHSVGTYVRHGSVSGLAMVVAHALRVGMPVWERGGDASQLGGEFVLGPGLSCTYVHRMQSPSGHASIVDVLAAAGLRSARKVAGAVPGPVVLATAPGTVRPSISLPLERGAGGRETKVLSVVREEACGACGACEGCAEALNIDSESTASGEWNIVVAGKAF